MNHHIGKPKIKNVINSKTILSITGLLFSSVSFTQTLQQVTDAGSTTTNSITVKNSSGLIMGVDPTAGYSIYSHSIKPSPVAQRTVLFESSTTAPSGGWTFYNSDLAKTLMSVHQNGNTGIGTNTPLSQLHLSSDANHALTFSRSNGTYGFRILRDASEGVVYFQTGTSATSASWETKIQMGEGEPGGKLILNPYGGNVEIGMHGSPMQMAVNGEIKSKKVKVTQTGWPDYVFDTSYRLPDLMQVEAFIKTNKRLENIPSAQEVEKNGLDVGENQAAMLRKIEELTLYMIQQQKEISEQRELILKQQQQLQRLEVLLK